MIIKELTRLASEETLVTLELDDIGASEVTGFICSATRHLVQVQQIGDDGRLDGHTVLEPEMIGAVWWDTRELQSIGRLAAERATSIRAILGAVTLRDAIVELSQRYPAIALHEVTDSESFTIARVEAHDSEWLKLKCYGTRRTRTRHSKLVKLEEISRVEFDTPYIADIVRLHDEET